MNNKILIGIIFCIAFGMSCSRSNPVGLHPDHIDYPDHPIHPPHPIVVSDTVFVDIPSTCQKVNLTAAGEVIKDQSPNLYDWKKNGVAVEREKTEGILGNPTTTTLAHTFENYDLLNDTFTLEVVSGSRAKVVSITVVSIACIGNQ